MCSNETNKQKEFIAKVCMSGMNMNLTELLKVTFTNNLWKDKDQSLDNKYVELNIQFKDGFSGDVSATIYDENLTELDYLTGNDKRINDLIKDNAFLKYIRSVCAELYRAIDEDCDWYRFFSFDVYVRDILEQANISKRIREALLAIHKAEYLVTYTGISPLDRTSKKVKYLISSNFALDTEIPYFHPLLQVFKKVNPNLDLVVDKIQNTFWGEDVYHEEYALVNRALGFVVKVSNITKGYEHQGGEEDFIRASYFHDPFNPIISTMNTINSEKCKL